MGRGMTLSNTCGDCRHFDKSAYPQNARFGRCRVTFKLQPLPMWYPTPEPETPLRNVADYYSAVNCALHLERTDTFG